MITWKYWTSVKVNNIDFNLKGIIRRLTNAKQLNLENEQHSSEDYTLTTLSAKVDVNSNLLELDTLISTSRRIQWFHQK